MPAEFICPNCHVSLDEKRLVTKAWTVQSCPHCQYVVRRHDAIRWQDRETLVHADVSAIEAWLAAVAADGSMSYQRPPTDYVAGRDMWQVLGVQLEGSTLPWDCTAEHSHEIPGLVELRLSVDHQGDLPSAAAEHIQAACAEVGVQPHAFRRTWTDWGSEHQAVRWGARQFLTTGCLSKTLFCAVVHRLDRAMRAAAARVAP
jgi:hypothetical protein